jgi:hypothetical protein
MVIGAASIAISNRVSLLDVNLNSVIENLFSIAGELGFLVRLDDPDSINLIMFMLR